MSVLPPELLYNILGLFVSRTLCQLLLDPDVDESVDRAMRPLLLVNRSFRQLTLDLLHYTLGEQPAGTEGKSFHYPTILRKSREFLCIARSQKDEGIHLQPITQQLSVFRTTVNSDKSAMRTLCIAYGTALLCQRAIDSTLNYAYDAFDPVEMTASTWVAVRNCSPPEPMLSYLVYPVSRAIQAEILTVRRLWPFKMLAALVPVVLRTTRRSAWLHRAPTESELQYVGDMQKHVKIVCKDARRSVAHIQELLFKDNPGSLHSLDAICPISQESLKRMGFYDLMTTLDDELNGEGTVRSREFCEDVKEELWSLLTPKERVEYEKEKARDRRLLTMGDGMAVQAQVSVAAM